MLQLCEKTPRKEFLAGRLGGEFNCTLTKTPKNGVFGVSMQPKLISISFARYLLLSGLYRRLRNRIGSCVSTSLTLRSTLVGYTTDREFICFFANVTLPRRLFFLLYQLSLYDYVVMRGSDGF